MRSASCVTENFSLQFLKHKKNIKQLPKYGSEWDAMYRNRAACKADKTEYQEQSVEARIHRSIWAAYYRTILDLRLFDVEGTLHGQHTDFALPSIVRYSCPLALSTYVHYFSTWYILFPSGLLSLHFLVPIHKSGTNAPFPSSLPEYCFPVSHVTRRFSDSLSIDMSLQAYVLIAPCNTTTSANTPQQHSSKRTDLHLQQWNPPQSLLSQHLHPLSYS